MKKLSLLLAAVIISLVGFSQDLYQLTKGSIKFYSEAPLENIEAVNEKSKSVLNLAKKQVAVVIPIINFKFESALMEEHFNENYMDTEKFPNGKLQGTINEDIDLTKVGEYDVTITGKLTIHGVEKERTIPVKLKVEKNKILANSKFDVKVADHDIEIPKIVFQNIAEVVEVTVNFEYEPKK